MPVNDTLPGLSPRLLAALALVGIASAVFGAALGARTQAEPERQPAAEAIVEFAPSDILTVRPARLEHGLPLTGTLSPLREARVKARIAGELVEVSVREGEAVRRGQVLARIDQTEVTARVAARSADVEAARAQRVLAEKNRSTQQALLDRNFISRNAFDATLSSYQVAEARLRSAQAELAMAVKSQGDAVLVAPFDGVIAERLARQGERVSVDAPLVTVVDLSRLELEAPVPAAQIGSVRIGQTVTFRVEGLGAQEFSGRIERINPATVAGTRSINVYAVIENHAAALRGGMFAHGHLRSERVEHALVIPLGAVHADSGGTVVYALESGALRRKPVRVSAPDAEDQVQVLAGLGSGAAIVRSNLGAWPDGVRARITGTPARGL